MEKSPVSNILNEINICFKVQTLILDVSDKFNRGNKSPELIQLIFSSLLKTYLFCYSIVSLALRTFISKHHLIQEGSQLWRELTWNTSANWPPTSTKSTPAISCCSSNATR